MAEIAAALGLVFLFLFDFGLMLGPGLAAATWVSKERGWSGVRTLACAIGVSAALGYGAFWCFFFHKPLGRTFCWLVYAASLMTMAMRRAEMKRVWSAMREPVSYAGAAGLFYLCCFFLFLSPARGGATSANLRFFTSERPGDNLIPLILGDRIYSHEPLRPFCCGDWLSSDRPPLQTGIFLLERPLRAGGSNDLNYELVSAGMQVTWICGVWALLEALGTERRKIRQTIVLLVFSGFLFYNSVYTWPKLLAAGLMLLGAAVVVEAIRAGRKVSDPECGLASGCFALALLAHPGCLFSLPAAALATVRFRRRFSWRGAALGLAVGLILLLPWRAYQAFVDPPGNRLLKMHLAGHNPADEMPVWQSITEAYKRDGLRTVLANKLSNIETLWGSGAGRTLTMVPGWRERLRVAEREWIFYALGALNAGWLAAVFLLVKGRRAATPHAIWLVSAALLNFGVWSAVMFGPAATVTTHSAYPDLLLLSVGLIGWLLALPEIVFGCVLALQILNLAVIWVTARPHAGEPASGSAAGLQMPLLVMACLIAAGLAWWPGLSSRGAADTIAG